MLLSLQPTTQPFYDPGSLVADIITHLSFIRPCDALFTATTWPTFIAGAETNDRETQEWVARRFQELWSVEPWGLIREALGLLEKIWVGRRDTVVDNEEEIAVKQGERDADWISDLLGSGADWLIL